MIIRNKYPIKSFNDKTFYSWYKKRKDIIIKDLITYINIDTSSPNEHNCFDFLNNYLEKLGFISYFEPFHKDIKNHCSFSPHFSSQIKPERGNIRSRPKNIDPSVKKILFNCHIDVVPATNDFIGAFDGYFKNNRIYGRGACDTKNNFIMLCESIRFLNENKIPFKKTPLIDLVIEEEIGGNGTLSTIMYGIEANEVICLEPTNLNIFRGHRGCITFEVEIKGRSVHMGSDLEGISAIDGAIKIINLLKKLEKKLLIEAKNDNNFSCWGKPLQLNIGIIKGGEWSGSLPEKCILECDLGFLPKYSLTEIESLILKTCKSINNPWISENLVVRFNGLKNDSYIIDKNNSLIKDFLKSCKICKYKQKEIFAWKVSCDARYYAKNLNIPVIIFGSGSLSNAHSANEYVELNELKEGIKILAHYLSI